MHEMAHIADFVSGPAGQFVGPGLLRSIDLYDRDGTGGWSYETTEYRPAALTEGLATAVSTGAFFTNAATNPRTCSVHGNVSNPGWRHCFTGSLAGTRSLEESHYGSCVAEEGRWSLSAMRFFWDIMDTVNDGVDNSSLGLSVIFDSIATFPCPSYPACYANGQLHDQYSFVPSDLNAENVSVSTGEKDDNNAWTFRTNMVNNYCCFADVEDQYYNNCMGFF